MDVVEKIAEKMQKATIGAVGKETVQMPLKTGKLMEKVKRDDGDNIDKVAQSEYMEKFMEALKKLGED